MRIALLSNVTLELLVPQLRDRHELWLPSGYGAWMETALNPPEGLKTFHPQVIFLLLDRSQNEVDSNRVDSALAELADRFTKAEVLSVDLEDLAAETGGFYDERMWSLAKMPWSQSGLKAIAAEIERLLELLQGKARKVLALDLDGVLWRGVIGEDGIVGIEPYREFQRELKRLQERGVLLTILSRNNPEDVEPIWNDPRMVLRREDFVAARIDWNEKSNNLKALATELNLGTDAFVFVDDNPAERLAMSARLPEVAVPEFPEEVAGFVRRLERLYFPQRRVTDEDRGRTEAYRSETRRNELKASVGFEDYLKSLDIRVEVHVMRPEEIDRVAQLSVKTNQFNVCTHRYSAEEIAVFANDGSRRIFTASVSDRYGDLGLVAFVQVQIDGEQAEILDWVMSCRAMNRRIEFTIEAAVEQELRAVGVRKVSATYQATAKNVPVRRLFDDFGFAVDVRQDLVCKYNKALI